MPKVRRIPAAFAATFPPLVDLESAQRAADHVARGLVDGSLEPKHAEVLGAIIRSFTASWKAGDRNREVTRLEAMVNEAMLIRRARLSSESAQRLHGGDPDLAFDDVIEPLLRQKLADIEKRREERTPPKPAKAPTRIPDGHSER